MPVSDKGCFAWGIATKRLDQRRDRYNRTLLTNVAQSLACRDFRAERNSIGSQRRTARERSDSQHWGNNRVNDKQISRVIDLLDGFKIETPSWGYADTGTRFGKFFQDAAAIDLNDKLADAGQVHQLTGCCPTVAVSVQWDFKPEGDPSQVVSMAKQHGISIGSINPNLFQDQKYKLGSFGSPEEDSRKAALEHGITSIQLSHQVKSKLISFWFADGTNYPGQDHIRSRKKLFESALKECHATLSDGQILLVEYKPFEPAFYHTDIADWGMAYLMAKSAGPQARVLVDTGHHYQAQNIEQIVAWLLDEDMLGGFHFNDRRYADDDLTLGSIDPYQIFRIFHEIHGFAHDQGGQYPDIAYMVDQSHNLKPKLEANVQTVMMAQEMYSKASLVDHGRLTEFQNRGDIVSAERELQAAFATDVRPAVVQWRSARGLASDPLLALRESGYQEKAAKDRAARRKALGIEQVSSYA